MIGEFVPGRNKQSDRPLLLIGVDIENHLALTADEGGALSVWNLDDISIDWHYDGSEGKWKPDFEEG